MSNEATPSDPSADASQPLLDDRLVQWMAAQMVQDARARLVEGGAGADATIALSSVFVDLPIMARGEWESVGAVSGTVLRTVCGQRAPEGDWEGALEEWKVAAQLLDTEPTSASPFIFARTDRIAAARFGHDRWLLVGGPGSGKSTATTMSAQMLRRSWVTRQVAVVPAELRAKLDPVEKGLDELATRLNLRPRSDALPIRVNLPWFAQWMVTQAIDDKSALLWRYLATRMIEDAATQGITLAATEDDVKAMVSSAGRVIWIFDGLDEVPRTANREAMLALIRALVCGDAPRQSGLLVTTRPQGYEGEFDELPTMVMSPMPVELAQDYGGRLLGAWYRDAADVSTRREAFRQELTRPEIQDLVQTPLHTTMAALLVAEDSLPKSRWKLFEHYFRTIFRRELGKLSRLGFGAEDEPNLRALHARVGLVLHVRAQAQEGVRSTMRQRELRTELSAIFREKGYTDEESAEKTERMMRFATERLVLLLHSQSGEYSFGIRSLQEFFAADALLTGERSHVRERLEVIALNPHWSNVLALIASKCALDDSGKAHADLLDYTVGLCRALNDGAVGGASAKRCLMGSRLALAMLRETERYGEPWLHNPLWDVALEAATSPPQFDITRRLMMDVRLHLGRLHSPAIWNETLEIHLRLGITAASWKGNGATVRHEAVLTVVRELFGSDAERRLLGWLLIDGFLRSNHVEAIRLADQHAPLERGEGRNVATALFAPFLFAEPSNWASQFVESHAEWFTPSWLPQRFRLVGQDPRQLVQIGLGSLAGPGSAAAFGLRVLCLAMDIIVVDQPVASSSRIAEISKLATEHVEWNAWWKLSEFYKDPSHATLADLLEVASDPRAFRELVRAGYHYAWPLSACLDFIDDPSDLRTLAERARDGALGTVDDWRSAESRWRASPDVDLNELHKWIAAGGLPWDRTIAERGVVLPDVMIFAGDGSGTEAAYAALWDRLCKQILFDPQRATRAVRILERLLDESCWVSLPIPASVIPLSVARIVKEPDRRGKLRVLFCVSMLLPDLGGEDSEDWFRVLDERGKLGKNYSCVAWSGIPNYECRSREIIDELMRRLAKRTEQFGLVTALMAMIRVAPDTNLSALPTLEIPADAHKDVHAASAFLRLLSGSHDAAEVTSLVRRLLPLAEADPADLGGLLVDVLSSRTLDAERLATILVALIDELPSHSPLRDRLLGALFVRLHGSARPVFATSDAWSEHHLPGPFLSGQDAEPCPTHIVQILELTNLRVFKETPSVDVSLPIPSANTGQWIVLTGENGVGKTTLLRALALTLASPAVASKLLDERVPMIRNGGEGRVTLRLDVGKFDAVLRFKERTETVETGPEEPKDARRPWVIGYGVGRGNARGEPDREVEWGPLGELHTLFDRPASLVNATEWLFKMERLVLREARQSSNDAATTRPGSAASIQASVEEALKALLPGVEAIERADEHVFVHHREFGRVRLDALSDGYLTTIGWVIDLIARWIERQRELDEPIGPNLLRQMTGFVLLDEIDLHLHPFWQLRVIDNVRAMFPRLSFVVTTHNPLTLQGARRGEVYVMRRDGARIELVQRDIRPGHDVDRVLFEQFGIEHTFDKDTRELLKRHRELLESGARFDDPKRVEIEAKLVERLGGFGETVRAERRAASDPLRPLTPEQKQNLASFLKKKP